MAKRKKRTKIQGKKRASARGTTRKSSLRSKATKRAAAKLTRPKRKGAKKASRKRVPVRPPKAPAAETVIVDVIEEPVPGVITVTEFEQTEIREGGPNWNEPEES